MGSRFSRDGLFDEAVKFFAEHCADETLLSIRDDSISMKAHVTSVSVETSPIGEPEAQIEFDRGIHGKNNQCEFTPRLVRSYFVGSDLKISKIQIVDRGAGTTFEVLKEEDNK